MFGNEYVAGNEDARTAALHAAIIRLSPHQRAVVIARLGGEADGTRNMLRLVQRVVSEVEDNTPAELANGLTGEVLAFGRLVE